VGSGWWAVGGGPVACVSQCVSQRVSGRGRRGVGGGRGGVVRGTRNREHGRGRQGDNGSEELGCGGREGASCANRTPCVSAGLACAPPGNPGCTSPCSYSVTHRCMRSGKRSKSFPNCCNVRKALQPTHRTQYHAAFGWLHTSQSKPQLGSKQQQLSKAAVVPATVG
jgi:hypothetical protein